MSLSIYEEIAKLLLYHIVLGFHTQHNISKYYRTQSTIIVLVVNLLLVTHDRGHRCVLQICFLVYG